MEMYMVGGWVHDHFSIFIAASSVRNPVACLSSSLFIKRIESVEWQKYSQHSSTRNIDKNEENKLQKKKKKKQVTSGKAPNGKLFESKKDSKCVYTNIIIWNIPEEKSATLPNINVQSTRESILSDNATTLNFISNWRNLLCVVHVCKGGSLPRFLDVHSVEALLLLLIFVRDFLLFFYFPCFFFFALALANSIAPRWLPLSLLSSRKRPNTKREWKWWRKSKLSGRNDYFFYSLNVIRFIQCFTQVSALWV